MIEQGKITMRAVTKVECPWLDDDVPEGARVYLYRGVTYGVIGPNGVAVSFEPDSLTFFELPREALKDHPKDHPNG